MVFKICRGSPLPTSSTLACPSCLTAPRQRKHKFNTSYRSTQWAQYPSTKQNTFAEQSRIGIECVVIFYSVIYLFRYLQNLSQKKVTWLRKHQHLQRILCYIYNYAIVNSLLNVMKTKLSGFQYTKVIQTQSVITNIQSTQQSHWPILAQWAWILICFNNVFVFKKLLNHLIISAPRASAPSPVPSRSRAGLKPHQVTQPAPSDARPALILRSDPQMKTLLLVVISRPNVPGYIVVHI